MFFLAGEFQKSVSWIISESFKKIYWKFGRWEHTANQSFVKANAMLSLLLKLKMQKIAKIFLSPEISQEPLLLKITGYGPAHKHCEILLG